MWEMNNRTRMKAMLGLGALILTPPISHAEPPEGEASGLEVAGSPPSSPNLSESPIAPPMPHLSPRKSRAHLLAELETMSPILWLQRFGPVEVKTRTLENEDP